jgi:hypothetical protein
MKRLAAAIAAAAAAVTLAVVTASPAQARFVCPDRDACFFPNTDWTGTPSVYYIPDPLNHGHWKTLAGAEKGSVNDNSGSAIEFWNAQTGFHTCVSPHTRFRLQNNFGHWYAAYGAADCSGIPDFN